MAEGSVIQWEQVASVASALVAFAALGFSIFTFKKQQDRAEKQQLSNEDFARASARPILKVRSLSYLDRQGIMLRNVGLGPAIIKQAVFSNGVKSTDNMVCLFDDMEVSIWKTFIDVPPETVIPAREDMTLLLREIALPDGKFDRLEDMPAYVREAWNEWQSKKGKVRISVDYTDIYGGRQERLEEQLKDRRRRTEFEA